MIGFISKMYDLSVKLTLIVPPNQFMPLLFTVLWLRSAFGAPSPRELDTRIVGGYPAAKGRYPYFTAVRFYQASGAGYASCGGTLIAKDIILCAAHCYDSTDFSLASSFVRVGIENTLVTTGYYQAYMEKVIPHPSYNSATFKNDVLVIKLKTAITQVAPVALNTNSAVPAVGAAEIVFGFGTTSSGGSTSKVLLEVGQNAVSYTTCNNYYGIIFDAGMTCSYSAGKDSCQGDSGGPLILGGSSSAATDIQVGIVSFGDGCAKIGVPGVYTRVSYYAPWIQSQICLWSSFKPATCTSTTNAPTSVPTQTPTKAPVTATKTPTNVPTMVLTSVPTQAPVPTTTTMPTNVPTMVPTSVPTQAPVPTTMTPTQAPVPVTKTPTKAPVPVTKTPTKAPVSATKPPTKAPTIKASRCKYYSRNAITALPNTCSCSTETCSCTNTADILKSNKGAVCKDCQWCLGGVCAVPFGTYGANSPYSPFGYGTGFTYTSGRTGKFIMTEELNASESFTYTCKAFYNNVQCTSCKYYSCGGNYWPYVNCSNIKQGATANFCYLNNGVPNNPNHLLFGLAVEYYSPCV